MSKYRVSWSRDGSIRKSGQSEVFRDRDAAMAFARRMEQGNRSVTLLKEHDDGVNAGKYFLDLIVK